MPTQSGGKFVDLSEEPSVDRNTDPNTDPTESITESAETSDTVAQSIESTTKPTETINDSGEPATKSTKSDITDAEKKIATTVNKLHSNSPVKLARANKHVYTNLVTPVVKKVPQTGERSNIPLWLSIAGTSAGVAATAIIAKRKKKI